MKHRVINRDKIVEVYVLEPRDDTNNEWIDNSHGWQVVLETEKEYNGTITIDMPSEADCINFINSLNFVKI